MNPVKAIPALPVRFGPLPSGFTGAIEQLGAGRSGFDAQVMTSTYLLGQPGGGVEAVLEPLPIHRRVTGFENPLGHGTVPLGHAHLSPKQTMLGSLKLHGAKLP